MAVQAPSTEAVLPAETLQEETTAPPSPEEAAYREAEQLLSGGETAKAAIAFGKLGDYQDAHARSMELWGDITSQGISAGGLHTIGLKSDGTVVATGKNWAGRCDVSDWTDIKIPKP